ncbi:hypothetical protein C4559_02035 [Candidatus Microgenomates bacterium]|nr:MAG: hypothetical protein C4559_02035 [Candidatus Microgenomates bacterium]
MKNINNFFSGKGISIKLPPTKANNLYRPTAQYGIECFNFVHVNKGCFVKKNAPIILKECFFLLKPSGYLIIDYLQNKDLSFQAMEELFWWLFKGNYEIKLHKKNLLSQIIVQKKKSVFTKEDNIEKWTFGIVTNGERNDWLEEIIHSIQNLKIPNYEIIVCGKYKNRKEKNFTYIDFNQRGEKGWITKKKNLICEKAKYENLCIIHDRLVFDKNWYEGIKKYGNAFELLGCTQIEKTTKTHAGDWLTLGGPIGTLYKIARIKETDWDYYTFLSGQLMIIKKSIWRKILWNETMYWGDQEDGDISFRARDLGYLIRFNPYSSLTALAWRFGNIPLKHDRSEGFFPKDMLMRRTFRFFGNYLSHIPFMGIILAKIFLLFKKVPIYKQFLYK